MFLGTLADDNDYDIDGDIYSIGDNRLVIEGITNNIEAPDIYFILGGLSRIVRIGPQTIGPQNISGIQMRLNTVVMVTNRIHVKRFNVPSSTI